VVGEVMAKGVKMKPGGIILNPKEKLKKRSSKSQLIFEN